MKKLLTILLVSEDGYRKENKKQMDVNKTFSKISSTSKSWNEDFDTRTAARANVIKNNIQSQAELVTG